jgi:hypothetical protein
MLVARMTAGCVVAAAAAVGWFGSGVRTEVVLGLLAPLLATGVTWVLTERVYRRHPERLTPLMVKAFGTKLVFFGGFVVFALKGLRVQPVPFMLSFTGGFVALYLTEALALRQLLQPAPDAPVRDAPVRDVAVTK